MSISQLSIGQEIRRRFGKDKVRFVIEQLGQPSVSQIKAMLAQYDPSFKTVNRALEDLVIDYTIEKVRVGVEWCYRLRPS